MFNRLSILILINSLAISSSFLTAQSLEQELQRASLAELAAEAKRFGDATRGAIVFHQPSMACAKCHPIGGDPTMALGPDLTDLGIAATDESLIESVLYPSKVIREGYDSVTILTIDGNLISALPVDQTADQIILRDVARDGELITIAAEEIEQIKQNELSIMPAGQMNQLNNRQQFYDLIRYLMEIRDGGAERAGQLRPSPSLLTYTIPEYENRIDHAGLIGSWNSDSLQRGEAIYNRVCANCHGTHTQVGSLPTSLRFQDGQFKNGIDPLSMYRTLTHGFGQMTPQTWMVPSQKYDVIHYIRQAYLDTHNPSQLFSIDETYLANLPKGDTWGPEPNSIQDWSAMDYGPSLIHTYEIPGNAHNFAYKGIAIRLDPGAGGVSRGGSWMVFDTDTLRVAAGWHASNDTSVDDNFIDWRAIQFNGEHGVHPRIVGHIDFANPTGPGWGEPSDGRFDDYQRVLGRDGRQYGPLPKAWGQFRGLYHHDHRVILSYTVGTTEVLEMPGLLQREASDPVLLRTFNIGPRQHDLILQVGQHQSSIALSTEFIEGNRSAVRVAPTNAKSLAPAPSLHYNGQTFVQINDAQPFNLTDKDFSMVARIKATSDGRIFSIIDGTDNGHDGFVHRGIEPIQPTSAPLVAGFAPDNLPLDWILEEGNLRLRIAAGQEGLRFSVWIPSYSLDESGRVKTELGDNQTFKVPPILDAAIDLASLIQGGPARWPEVMTTQATIGADDGPFAVDILTAPETNPWLALTRFTGLDFYPDGRIAVCSWDGDVWIVTPRQEDKTMLLDWRRIASGLFQPLGLKIVDDKIHLICRDQLTVLHDLNGNGETDFYQCLNNDHQVTEHFHEFAMGLQTDEAGNFYYAKSGCHGKAAVVPHHGTLLKVTPDGSRTEILANGFRAANGVCLNPDGSFLVTDQEGFWNPKNRINWVTISESGPPNFYGNMLGYHDIADSSDSAMVPPLCWITNDFDRSPAELLWVNSDRWGPLKGNLLNLSYGYGKAFVVPHEQINGLWQGGMIELPLPSFPTGIMRGRFHPGDGQLYVCGMFAWAGNATHPGGLYRIRYTDQPVGLPLELKAYFWGVEITFAEPVDPDSVSDLQNYAVEAWDLKRTARYGSEHIDQRVWSITAAQLSTDGKTLRLQIPDIAPTWGMEIIYRLKSADGQALSGKIHNTIHQLRDAEE